MGKEEFPLPGICKGISAGLTHSIGLNWGGTITNWRHKEHYGMLVNPVGLFTQVAAGYDHFLALRRDRSIVCWGSNSWGQCAPPDGLFKQVTAGMGHSVGLVID